MRCLAAAALALFAPSPPALGEPTPEAPLHKVLYAIVRKQGRFSTKFQLAEYPFDTQFLNVVMEDTTEGVTRCA
jgi:hypothetical protein